MESKVINIGIDLNTTKGYPMLQQKNKDVFDFVDTVECVPGTKIAYKNALFQVDSIIEEREPRGENTQGAIFYRVQTTPKLAILKIREGYIEAPTTSK